MAGADNFLASIGIDPDFPINTNDVRTSGMIVPTVYEKFSGSNVNSDVIAIINNPKNTLTYVVTANGRLISYDSSLGTETLIGTVTGGVAQGGWYYNNYIYIPTGTDVSRYGPLDNLGSAAITNSWWTGLGLTALTNTTYPTIRSVSMPNHWGCIHGDGSSYFLDFKDGQGIVNRINTKKGTYEGELDGTVAPSAYNVLDLPFGFYPVAICSYSTDLAILTMQTTSSTVSQGKAALFLWDPTNIDTFYRGPVYLPDALATAQIYANGILYLFSGNAVNGMRMSAYSGGDTVSDSVYLEEGVPPLAGAVETAGNRIMWGGSTTYPSTSASVFAYGSKNSKLPKGINNIAKTTSSGASPMVTAIKVVQQASNITPKPIVGWRDGSGYGIDRLSSTATYSSVINLQTITVGRKFKIIEMRIPLGAAVAANMTVTPKLYFDEESSSFTLPVINNTNYPSQRKIIYKEGDLDDTAGGENNFFLQLSFTGSDQCPVTLPIEFTLEVYDDESNPFN